MDRSLMQLGDFFLLEKLGEGAMSEVYRARRGDDIYAIKLLNLAIKENSASYRLDIVRRFRRETAALARLNHPGLVKIIEAGDIGEQPYLLMELVEGDLLSQVIHEHHLTESPFLALASSLATILSEVHRHGLVHQDLKPSNIIMQFTGEPKLIDFGLAAFALDRQEERAQAIGTFLYAAPEQTGMLKRPVDQRTDLYALGVILFECLTGRAPFLSDDVAELLHQHATMLPPKAGEICPEISPVLDLILAKLLAKDPDDRYQSAEGLLADLKSFSVLSEQQRSGQPVVLGKKDTHRGLFFQTAYIGHQKELQTLANAWQKITTKGTLVIVEGEGGSGKTRLIHEFSNKIRSGDMLLLSGKAQQAENIPLACLREAIENHLVQILQLSEDAKKEALGRLRRAAADNYHLIRNLSVGIKMVLPEEEKGEKIDLDPERFYQAVAEFFCQLARISGRVILHLDDLQWIDEASLKVISQMAKSFDWSPMMIACTMRNDEASEQVRQEILRTFGHAVDNRLTLFPLNEQEANELIAAHLGGNELERTIVQRIMERAGGNPFALGEYVNFLLDLGVLRPQAGAWIVDKQQFSEVTLPTNVVDLVLRRTKHLSDVTSEVLSIAAVIGGHIQLDLLQAGCRLSEQQLCTALGEALQSQIIEQKDDHSFSFLHDRLREGFLARLSTDQLKDVHQLLADILHDNPQETPEYVFALARHYAHGYAENFSRHVFESNFTAGKMALSNYAYDQALEYLQTAERHIEQETLPKKTLAEFNEALGDVYYGKTNFVKAVEYFTASLSINADKLPITRIRYKLARIHFTNYDSTKAKEEIHKAFKTNHIHIPKSSIGKYLSAFRCIIIYLFSFIFPFFIKRNSNTSLNQRKLIIKLYHLGIEIGSFSYDKAFFIFSMAHLLLNSRFLVTSSERAETLSLLATVFANYRLKHIALSTSNKAMSIARQINDPTLTSYVSLYHLLIYEAIGECNILDKKASEFKQHLRWLPLQQLAYYYGANSMSRLTRGYIKEGLELQMLLLKTQALSLRGQHTQAYAILSACHMILGNYQEAVKNNEKCVNLLPDFYTKRNVVLNTCISHLLLHYLNSNSQDPNVNDLIDRWDELQLSPSSLIHFSRHIYVYLAHIRMQQYFHASANNRSNAKHKLKIAMSDLVSCAKTGHHKCHVHLIRSALFREEGNHSAAKKNLSYAEILAKHSDSPWCLFEIACERARIAQSLGDHLEVQVQTRYALDLAKHHSWQSHKERLIKEFRLQEKEDRLMESPATISSTSTRLQDNIHTARYLEALLEVSLASSSAFDPEQQASAALDTIVKLLGGERAFLFLGSENEPERLQLLGGRDKHGNDLQQAANYSTTAIRKVCETIEPLVVTGTSDGLLLGSQSAVAHNLRSIIAAPLLLQGNFLGVVYVDNNLVQGAFGKEDVKFLLAMANHIAVSVETARNARLEIQRRELEKDMELTAAVQSFFLPKESYHVDTYFSLAATYQPATICGGDLWWYHQPSPESIIIFLGDVTGHGAASAMLTAFVAAIYRTIRDLNLFNNPSELIQYLHHQLSALCEGKYYMTLGVLHLEGSSGTLRLLSAASPPVMILEPSGNIRTLLKSSAPIGLNEFNIGETILTLQGGERILLFTDGVFEQKITNNRTVGMKTVSKIFVSSRSLSLQEAQLKLIDSLNASRKEIPQEDDITFIMLDYNKVDDQRDISMQ